MAVAHALLRVVLESAFLHVRRNYALVDWWQECVFHFGGFFGLVELELGIVGVRTSAQGFGRCMQFCQSVLLRWGMGCLG